MKFSSQLSQQQRRLNLSQTQIAALLGCHKNRVWEWLHGLCEPDPLKQRGILSTLSAAEPHKTQSKI